MLTVPATPAPRADSTGSFCRRILGLHERLSAQRSLAPSPVVDALFGNLVSACVSADGVDVPAVLADPRIHAVRPDLVRLCAEGESLLERAWARRALAADDPHAETAAFPYLSNYEQLARLELHALAGTGHRAESTRRICFVGGGPLPLSAVLLGRHLAAEVTVVDRDARAVDLSGRLTGRLAPAGRIRVVLADAASAPDMARTVAGSDVVVVAALVGMTAEQKRTVLRAIGAAVRPGAYVVIRSADGLRSLLYPVVDLRDVRHAGLTPEVLVHPLGEVINSVLVARRR